MKKTIIILFTIYSLFLVNTNITYAADSCYLWNTLVKDWNYIDAFSAESASSCSNIQISRLCSDGDLLWNDLYQYATCEESNTLSPTENVEIWASSNGNSIKLDLLDNLKGEQDINVWNNGEESVINLLYTIAKDIKTIFYILSWLYFLVIVIKLIFASNTEEEVWNFKKGLMWITIWIVFMQISYYFVNVLYAKEVWWALATSFTNSIINPIIKALETAASFFFLLVAIAAFYKIITANWDEEKVKSWKMSIFYWLIWFIVIKIANEIVTSVYWIIDCDATIQTNWNKCIAENQLSWVSEIIVNIINWMNNFVGIILIIMIIYAGVQVLFWTWDDDRLSKVKKSITYIVIWIGILVLNYFILTFFITPEVAI